MVLPMSSAAKTTIIPIRLDMFFPPERNRHRPPCSRGVGHAYSIALPGQISETYQCPPSIERFQMYQRPQCPGKLDREIAQRFEVFLQAL